MNRTFQAISAMFSLQSLFSNAICSGHKITKYLDCVLSLGSRWIIRTFARSRVFQVRSPSNSPLPHFPCFRRIWPSLLCLISITFGAQNAYAYCWARPAPSEIETLRILTATDPRAAIARAQQQLGNLGSRNGEQVAWLYSVIAGAQFVTNGTSEVAKAAQAGLALAGRREDGPALDLRIALANSRNDTKGVRQAIVDLGNDLHNAKTSRERACILLYRGLSYDTLNETHFALTDMTDAYVLSENFKSSDMRAAIVSALADMLAYRKLLDFAMPLFEEADAWVHGQNATYEVMVLHVRMGLAYSWVDQPDKAAQVLERVLRDSPPGLMPPDVVVVVRASLCRAYVRLGQLRAAAKQCWLAQELDYTAAATFTGTIMRAKAELALAQGRPRETLAYLDKADNTIMGTPYPDSLYTRAQAYAALGNNTKAYEAMQAYRHVRDEQDKDDHAVQSEAFQARVTAMEKEGERIALDRDLKVSQARQEAQKAWLWIVTISGSIIIVLLAFVTLLSVRHHRRVQRLAAQTERAAQEKIEGMSRISHEIRSPIGSMTLLASAMGRQPHVPDDQRRLLAQIDGDGQRVTRMLSDMLDFSRLEAGALTLSPARLDLQLFLDDVIARHVHHAKEKGLTLAYDTDESVSPIVEVDPERLRQILDNLIANAIRFTDHGGVTLIVRPGPHTSDVEFAVKDTGIGIPGDQADRLFQAWQQIDAPAHRRGGTGLGLMICRALVEKMGGAIHVEAQISGGAAICFVLPMIGRRPAKAAYAAA